jgi:hypothetical protein
LRKTESSQKSTAAALSQLLDAIGASKGQFGRRGFAEQMFGAE